MGQKPAKPEVDRIKRGEDESQAEQEERQQHDWADDVAAHARTADDPRTVAPHDRSGRPSTGAAP